MTFISIRSDFFTLHPLCLFKSILLPVKSHGILCNTGYRYYLRNAHRSNQSRFHPPRSSQNFCYRNRKSLSGHQKDRCSLGKSSFPPLFGVKTSLVAYQSILYMLVVLLVLILRSPSNQYPLPCICFQNLRSIELIRKHRQFLNASFFSVYCRV